MGEGGRMGGGEEDGEREGGDNGEEARSWGVYSGRGKEKRNV